MRFRDLSMKRGVLVAFGGAVLLLPILWLIQYSSSAPSVCVRCHREEGRLWRASRVHPVKVGCEECHRGERTMDATPATLNAHCLRCHGEVRGQVWEALRTVPVKFSHRYHLQEGLVCTDCHRRIVHERSSPGTNRPLKADCLPCHLREMEWGEWRGACDRCHYIALLKSR